MKKILRVILIIFIVGICIVFSINNCVKNKYRDYIIKENEVSKLEDVDAIVVLGAKVNSKNQLSLMLKDRLDKGIEVFNYNISDTLLMSGDGVSSDNNETRAMVNYAKLMEVPIINIKEDTRGLSTYESMYRLKHVYNYKKVVVVTQKYHLYRAIYIANELGIEAYGVSAREKEYRGQATREVREVLARNKDFVYSLIKHKVTLEN